MPLSAGVAPSIGSTAGGPGVWRPGLVLRRRGFVLGALVAAAAGPSAAIAIDGSTGQCLVPVLLDGKPARLVLDTGAERSMLAQDAVMRLGLRSDPWVATTMRGAGGLVRRTANAQVAVLQAGGVRLFARSPGEGLSLPVTTADLGGADGLLGGDLLRHTTVVLDMRRSWLVLAPSGRLAMDAAAALLPLVPLRKNLLCTAVRVDGHVLTALVDTGAGRSLINKRGSIRLGLNTDADPVVELAGIGGRFDARAHRFGALDVGALHVPAPVLVVSSEPEPAYDMVLGLDILGRARVAISYAAMTLGLG